MSLSADEKSRIVESYGKGAQDTGSVEVQIALLTKNITKLTEHFKTHAKDLHSRRGLIRQVNLRRSLLKYLTRINPLRYRDIVTKLNLRG
jgi:small subunit ribosomal protein S15